MHTPCISQQSTENSLRIYSPDAIQEVHDEMYDEMYDEMIMFSCFASADIY